MNKWLVGLTCAWMGLATAMGAQNIADGTPVAQNFDSIGATATATLPTDWKTDKQTTARTLGTFAAAVTATERVDGQSVSGTAGNGIYNLGAPLDDSVDRAIGWLSSSSATKSGNLYVEMVNSGAESITNLFINYNVEKYRNGSNLAGFQIQLYYSTDGATWTSAGATFLTAFPADADSLGFATPPGATVAVSGNLDLSATPIAASANVYLAWNYSVQSGTTTSSAQLLGVDDVSIALSGTAIPTVNFFASGAVVDENQGTYQVSIYKSMAEGDVSGEIALSGTAAYGGGADYTVDTTNFTMNGATTSATVMVTINDDADPEAAETIVMTLANLSGATPVSPSVFTVTVNASDIPAHAITVTPPVNGTVTTDPVDEALEGSTVTITATPADGYRVASVAVLDGAMNPVGVSGSQPTYTFTMPTSDATVTALFEIYDAPDALINFEDYTAGYASNNYSAASVSFGMTNVAAGDLVGDAKNGLKSGRFAHLRGGGVAMMMQTAAFAQPITKINFWYANYGTEDSVTFKVQVSSDGASWQDVGEAAYDPASTILVEGVIDTIPAGMTYMQFLTTGGTAGQRMNIDDIGVYFGAASFGVTFDKVNGFVVPEGSGSTITATAANGVAPYSYSWTSTLGEGYRTADTNVFTILATAPIGDYSAEVVATDSDAPAKSVTNSLNFSVVAPPTKYAIAIVTNNPGEGTVTTTPATEAAEGVAVTINITPADGYRAASVAVNGGAVAVVGNAFTMPAEPVTVTVTFEVYDAPDLLIDFETNTTLSGSAYTAGTSLVNNVSFAHQRVLRGSLANDRVHGTYAGRFYPQGGTNGLLATTAAFAEPISKISFWHANYGTDNGTTFKVQVSPDGAAWEDVGAVIDPESTTLTEVVLESVPANATYIQFVTVAGTARVNVDDIGLWFGEPVFGVSVNKANGFTVNEGSSDTITATAANGTGPYTYGWTSTLGGAHYATNANVFTILATAPTGSYSATVTATDATNATAQKTVTFSVVGLAPGQPAVLISGNLSGTVGVQMDLSITVTNETANDWLITLKDPDGLDDYSYGFVPPAFTLTPTKSGTYVLTAEAQTGSGNFSNTVNLAVSGGGGDVWQIGNAGDGGSMFYALTNITIVLPTNYTLYAVYGSDTTAGGINGWPWPLVPASNYTWNPGTRTLTLPTSVTNRRIYRIGANPP